MIEVKKSIEVGQPLGLYNILTQLQSGSYGAMQYNNVFFVQANAGKDSLNSGAGKSWDTAYKTLAFALAAADADISNSDQGYGRGWAARNAVFCQGTFTEDLVLLADKTDIIGCGAVNTMTRLTRTQVPADNTYSTRFFNFEFRDDGSTAMWTFAAGAFEFHNCWFRNWVGITGTHAISINDPSDVRIEGCKFSSWPGTNFTTAAIALTATTGAANVRNCYIVGNHIKGAKGITVGEGVYTDCWIENNFIEATTFLVQDISVDTGAEGFFVINNRMITAADNTTVTNVIDCNAQRAAGNIITGTNATENFPTTAD